MKKQNRTEGKKTKQEITNYIFLNHDSKINSFPLMRLNDLETDV